MPSNFEWIFKRDPYAAERERASGLDLRDRMAARRRNSGGGGRFVGAQLRLDRTRGRRARGS
jgi:hypothetical protein